MVRGCLNVQLECDTGEILYCFKKKNTGILNHHSVTSIQSHVWETNLSSQEVIMNQFACCCANGTSNSQEGEAFNGTTVKERLNSLSASF